MIAVDAIVNERKLWARDFGQTIEMMRRNRQLTRGQLADMAGISLNQYCGYCVGRNEPTAYIVYRLAESLNTSADILLGIVR